MDTSKENNPATMDTSALPSPPDNMTVITEAMKILEEDIFKLENHIHEVETKYLENTSAHGNIVRGWEGYLDSKPGRPHMLRRPRVYDKDRIFSSSSSTSSLPMNENLLDEPTTTTVVAVKRGKGYKRNKKRV